MSLQDSIAAAVRGHNELAAALARIAHGRPDNGRPLAAETARQLARDTLHGLGLDWDHVLKTHAEFEPIIRKLRT